MKKLFTSDKFYLTVTVVGFIAFAVAIIIGLVSYPGYTTINQNLSWLFWPCALLSYIVHIINTARMS